jgi:flagellar motor switch/type III secretory pathway protein FliN
VVTVAAFDLASCPRVGARVVANARAAARVLADLPAQWRVELPPLGSATLTVLGTNLEPDGQNPSAGRSVDGSFAVIIGRGRDVGRMAVSSSLAARLVDAALGSRGGLASARVLGPAERGVLVALLAPVLAPLGWWLTLTPASAAPAPHGSISVTLRIEGGFGVGALRLDLPLAASGSVRHWPARAGRLPVVACLEIAATELPTVDVVGLAVGDAVVFDGRPAASYLAGAGAAEPWEGRLAVGVYAAPVHIQPNGEMELVGDFQMIETPVERTVAIQKGGAMDSSGPTEKAGAVLAAAPIEVVAELARITLRGDEVLGLAPGVVLTVVADRRHAIALRVGGELWAEGELVDVEGELGVRVTRLLRPDR